MIIAGPITFTPQEIAVILAVIAAAVLVATAPLALLAAMFAADRARKRDLRGGWCGAGAYVVTVAAQISAAVVYFRLR